MRILRAERVDKLSAGFLNLYKFKKYLSKSKKTFYDLSLLYYIDEFPYRDFNEYYYESDLIGLSESELRSFYTTWKRVDSSVSFNFIKMMLTLEDEVAAKEIYAAESLSRYISSMLYCLVISDSVLLITVLIDFISSAKTLLWPLLVGTIILLIVVILCYNKRCYCEYFRIYHSKSKKNESQENNNESQENNFELDIRNLKKLRNTSVFYLIAFCCILLELIFIVWFGLKKENYLVGLSFTTYLFGIFAILRNFRVIRHKEVDTVFALAFKNRARLFNSKGSNDTPKSGHEKQPSG